MRNTTYLFALLAVWPIGGMATGADWITAPSTFTHDPTTGERVAQFAPIGPVYASNHQRSVYHHTRSTLQVGDSIDIYHQTDEYGNRVRPYGEWRFPFRPFSVPYGQWGPPYAGLYGGFGFGGGGFGVDPAYGVHQPWFNGYYPDVRRRFPFPNPNLPRGGAGAGINIGPGNNGDVSVDNGIAVPGDGNAVNSFNGNN